MKIYIYGLYNTFSDEIRYIGKTNNLKRRLSEHIREAKSEKYSYFPKNKWILKTLSKNGKIKIKTIEVTNEIEWEIREKFWIEYYRKNSSNKNLNIRDGGEGFCEQFFLGYIDCKNWVNENLPAINTEKKWKLYVKENILPDNIPHSPSEYYENFSWEDFFGKNKKNKLFDCFTINDLKQIIRNKKLYTFSDFSNFFKKDYKIPKKSVFLENGFDIIKYLKETWFVDYSVFKQYIKIFFPNIISINDFKKEHKKMSKRIPFYLKKYYGNDFDNFEFLNFKRRGNETYHVFRDFYSYEECKKIVLKMGFKNSVDFRMKVINIKDLDPRIPHSPEIVYINKGWNGWEDFLGYKSNKRRKKCDLNLFVRYMRIFHKNVKNSEDYRKMYISKNVSKNLPKRPDVKYKMKWKDLFDLINNNYEKKQ